MAEWINDPQGREEIEKVTKELKLPVWKANHKGKFRDFWNELWDKIEDYILKLKGDTEKNSKGLNDRLVSAVGKHDGDFPIANAVVGNVYYSELTKKYYKCKVGGPAPMPNGNFVDMSILENLNRLENLNTSDYKILLDKSYISGKNIFTTNEIIWGVSELAEYKKAIKNYPFIVIQFFSTHTSIISSLFKSDNSRLFVPIPNPESEHTIFQIVESDNSFQVFRTYNFSNIKCTGLRIMGVKIF